MMRLCLLQERMLSDNVLSFCFLRHIDVAPYREAMRGCAPRRQVGEPARCINRDCVAQGLRNVM